MLLSDEIIKILCCPKTKLPLKLLDQSAIDKINKEIENGELKYFTGDTVHDKIDGGFLRIDGKLLFPIKNEIPVLIMDEAIDIPIISKL
jgi:uncharacterized protein YbaR (Trm112 family)